MAKRSAPLPPLTTMDIARYYMGRLAMRVDAEHFQELCRTVAYAVEPDHTAYRIALDYGLADLMPPDAIRRTGTLPPPRGGG